MKGSVEAVLFDLDGTLLDTAPDMANAANCVLRDHGLPPLSESQIQANTSHGARGLLRTGFGDALQGKDLDQLRLSFLEHYAENICTTTTLYSGVIELLEQLTERQIPWGIVTNKPGFLTGMLLPYFPLLLQARTIVCADTTPHAKPHPAPLLHGASILTIKPEQCLYVGDIQNDIVAAKAANMMSAVASWGYIGETDRPTEWEADQIFNKPVEILSLF
ncbi:HAD-IA family hydrolase [Grimontia kaedaensis]|uniref:HAD-IA family hydrolase n=1 Tax=Grimontia kaedaensis TaxID=2872157 RepID=A0ABY4WPQ8_9GAMM|nr:HAD-IA family hydrolase [Grimontia kaedaensis]USH01518.1 HAD-IA family hydrolase [Grimontia kaedaensis]